MQAIGNMKSVIYGIIITTIFVVSSCEFSNQEFTEAPSSVANVHAQLDK